MLLGGVALVGGSALLDGVREEPAGRAPRARRIGDVHRAGDRLLDEIADTILPTRSTPGAKAAKTGAFMALMVTDSYKPADQKVFRDWARAVDEATQKAHKVAFMAATPQQRLAVLDALDREQKTHMDEARDAARRARKGGPAKAEAREERARSCRSRRQQAAPAPDAGVAPAITADSPAHYFRMMKELALLGYFTSEIGCTQALRYVESPGRFEPCVPYTKGETAWAPHA